MKAPVGFVAPGHRAFHERTGIPYGDKQCLWWSCNFAPFTGNDLGGDQVPPEHAAFHEQTGLPYGDPACRWWSCNTVPEPQDTPALP